MTLQPRDRTTSTIHSLITRLKRVSTSGRGSGVVGYNVQVAVDTENHLIVTHEVMNVGMRGCVRL